MHPGCIPVPTQRFERLPQMPMGIAYPLGMQAEMDPMAMGPLSDARPPAQALLDVLLDQAQDDPYRTMRMLRNIPGNYTGEMVRKQLDYNGFKYVFFFYPLQFRNYKNHKKGSGLGYAFVGFLSEEEATSFQDFNGFKWPESA